MKYAAPHWPSATMLDWFRHNLPRVYARSIFLLLVLVASLLPLFAKASSSAPSPIAYVRTVNQIGIEVYSATDFPYPYSFGASIVWPAGVTPNYAYDVYFGILSPDGSVSTWGEANNHQLSAGLYAFARSQDGASFYASSHAGRDMEYRFSSHSPVGMYLVFVLVTAAGADPGNPLHWNPAAAAPLFFQPSTAGQ